mgnify:CR=1 FL=1
MNISAIGNLTDDCKFRQNKDGNSVANFTICYNKPKTDDRLFLSCSIWGNLAVSLNAYLTKGKQVYVDGELSVREYEYQGQNRWSLECRARTIQLLGSRDSIKNDMASVQKTRLDNDQDNFSPPDMDDEIPF